MAEMTLTTPFPAEQVGKLPRVTCKLCRESRSKVCSEHKKTKCGDCGNWITTAHIHLDYVGHAHVTARLLEVDPEWTWEPYGLDEHGGPLVTSDGKHHALWIRLTVAGVTRPGVGVVNGDKDDLEKELISDAIRNAAMRFGVALNLWAKGDLHAEPDEGGEPPAPNLKELGWATKKEYDEAVKLARTRSRSLPVKDQEALQLWWADQAWHFPIATGQMDAWLAKIDEFAGVSFGSDTVDGGTDQPDEDEAA